MSDQSPSKNPPPRVIAIDGPAGCGKSTVVRLLVERLEAHGATALSFSTGLVYRALTWCALERELDPSDRGSVRAMVEEVSLQIIEADGGLRVEVAGVDPGAALHSTRVTESIHWIADDPEVRAAVLPLQRNLPYGPVILAAGRDLGTVVYPEAPVKIFLTASLSERARRRHAEFRDRLGEEISLEEVEKQLRTRDDKDSSRAVAPLRPAVGARVIDTSDHGPDQVIEWVWEEIPTSWIPGRVPE